MKLGVCIMCKNEQEHIGISLASIKDIADCLILYDTGSTDRTISIVRAFADEHKIPLVLHEGVWIDDFAHSRNQMLSFADETDMDFILMLDVNDEVVGGQYLRDVLSATGDAAPKDAYFVNINWRFNTDTVLSNVRVIRNRCGFRYVGVVHEYIHRENFDLHAMPLLPIERFKVFNDRTKDTLSGNRYARDKVCLTKAHAADPTNSRTIYYLAQTYLCLGDSENAFKYYSLYTTLASYWFEERFQAFLHMGCLSRTMKRPWAESLAHFLSAYAVIPRAEPLMEIVGHYREAKEWATAYGYVKLACSCPYPVPYKFIVNKSAYEYERWHWLGVISYYAGHNRDGVIGCVKALHHKPDSKLDLANLMFYKDRIFD